jgi:hypothetical protein
MATVTDRPRPTSGLEPKRSHPAHVLAPLTAGAAALFAVAAAVVAIMLAFGSGVSPPATGAATVVPANTLLYLHVSTDPSRAPVSQMLAQLRRLPTAPSLFAAVTGRLDAMLSGSDSGTVDFATDVRPWLGREAALAVLDTPGPTAGTLIVLDLRDRARARAFLEAQGAFPAGAYRKVSLLQQPSGAVLAFLGHYLVIGQATSVDAAIDVATGHGSSLAQSAAYQSAAAGEPDDRVLDFYAPADGVRRALLPRPGLLGALGVLLDQPALRATTISLSPASGGLSARIHSSLDPKLARMPTAHTRAITPSIAAALPTGSMLLLDVGNLRRAAPKLLAAAAKLGVADRAATLLGQLGSALTAQGVNLDRLFSIFGHETALAVVPGRGSGPAPVLVGRTDNPAVAQGQLAALEGPLSTAFTPPSGGAGVVPEVAATTVGGVTISQLTLTPGLGLDWGVSHGLVVLSTSAGAVANVLAHRAALGGERAYGSATGGFPSQVTSLVFFDLGPLLRLGEQTGLVGGNTLQGLSPDLEQLRAIGLESTRGTADTTTELQLQIR